MNQSPRGGSSSSLNSSCRARSNRCLRQVGGSTVPTTGGSAATSATVLMQAFSATGDGEYKRHTGFWPMRLRQPTRRFKPTGPLAGSCRGAGGVWPLPQAGTAAQPWPKVRPRQLPAYPVQPQTTIGATSWFALATYYDDPAIVGQSEIDYVRSMSLMRSG
jgi:hypothetical protein